MLYDTADRLDLQAEACRPRSESFVNPAKILAITLADSIPMVLGDGPLNGVAAVRAASMLSRTARMPASYGELPDDASQIVATFDGPFTAGGGRGRGRARVRARHLRRPVPGRPGPAPPRAADAARRADHARHAGERGPGGLHRRGRCRPPPTPGVRVASVVAEPGHPLVRLAGQIAQTDFAATYLAIGLGLDPAVSPHVADLRDRTSR